MFLNLLKNFPKDYNKNGKFKATVVKMDLFKETISFEEEISGPKWKAYLKVKKEEQKAKKQKEKEGESFSVLWSLIELK